MIPEENILSCTVGYNDHIYNFSQRHIYGARKLGHVITCEDKSAKLYFLSKPISTWLIKTYARYEMDANNVLICYFYSGSWFFQHCGKQPEFFDMAGQMVEACDSSIVLLESLLPGNCKWLVFLCLPFKLWLPRSNGHNHPCWQIYFWRIHKCLMA